MWQDTCGQKRSDESTLADFLLAWTFWQAILHPVLAPFLKGFSFGEPCLLHTRFLAEADSGEHFPVALTRLSCVHAPTSQESSVCFSFGQLQLRLLCTHLLSQFLSFRLASKAFHNTWEVVLGSLGRAWSNSSWGWGSPCFSQILLV